MGFNGAFKVLMPGCYPVKYLHRVSQISDEKHTNKHADDIMVQGS